MTSQVDIVDSINLVQGPDRADIIMAYLKYGGHANRVPASAIRSSPDLVYFVGKMRCPRKGVLQDERFYVTISGLHHADDTGKLWQIEGKLLLCPLHFLPTRSLWDSAASIDILYETDTKKGTLHAR